MLNATFLAIFKHCAIFGDFFLTYLPGHQGFTRPRGSIQQNTLDMFTTQLLNDLRRKDSGGKSSPKNGIELVIQTANAHLGKIPIRIDD